ncbi:MAG: DUF2442 domain-containing protein [Microthrixaceae bacterium]
MSAPYEVRAVEHVDGHRLRLTFADGMTGEIDLTARFAGQVGPMFEPPRGCVFAQVAVDEELGTIVWPNGADLAPDALHEQMMSLA